MLHFLFSPEPVSAAELIASTILLTRVHMHARERQYPDSGVCLLFPAAVMQHTRIACFCDVGDSNNRLNVLNEYYHPEVHVAAWTTKHNSTGCYSKTNQDLKIYQICSSCCCVAVKPGRGPHVWSQVNAHGGQDINTEPNNILADLRKQYVFLWLFPDPSVCQRTFSNSHPRRHIYYPQTAGRKANRRTFRGGNGGKVVLLF